MTLNTPSSDATLLSAFIKYILGLQLKILCPSRLKKWLTAP